MSEGMNELISTNLLRLSILRFEFGSILRRKTLIGPKAAEEPQYMVHDIPIYRTLGYLIIMNWNSARSSLYSRHHCSFIETNNRSVLCGDLTYVILFPQLILVLYFPPSNTYGSVFSFLISFILRILCGDKYLGNR